MLEIKVWLKPLFKFSERIYTKDIWLICANQSWSKFEKTVKTSLSTTTWSEIPYSNSYIWDLIRRSLSKSLRDQMIWFGTATRTSQGTMMNLKNLSNRIALNFTLKRLCYGSSPSTVSSTLTKWMIICKRNRLMPISIYKNKQSPKSSTLFWVNASSRKLRTSQTWRWAARICLTIGRSSSSLFYTRYFSELKQHWNTS